MLKNAISHFPSRRAISLRNGTLRPTRIIRSSLHIPSGPSFCRHPPQAGAALQSYRPMSSQHSGESTLRPQPDKVLQDIADYVHNYKVDSELAWETARLCLIDTIGCGLEALRFPECARLLGPV